MPEIFQLILQVLTLAETVDCITNQLLRWLDVIQASAAGAWIMIVGTHLDSMVADNVSQINQAMMYVRVSDIIG